DPRSLAELANVRVRATQQTLTDALNGQVHAVHRQLLHLSLERLALIENQILQLDAALRDQLQSHRLAMPAGRVPTRRWLAGLSRAGYDPNSGPHLRGNSWAGRPPVG